ncbi:hypothetical protein AB6N24_03675 [Cellulomonas sp. 179-A 4D5 NHS]|uniref:hypothetical protein n=1 Tax=Cellulomonas sp. 179-A 4D5 NHS TaxID=3142378 RepID=UPI0039A26937
MRLVGGAQSADDRMLQTMLRRRPGPTAPAEAEFSANVIDAVTLAPDQRSLTLIIVADESPTGSDRQTEALQWRVNDYAAYALVGQMAVDYPGW